MTFQLDEWMLVDCLKDKDYCGLSPNKVFVNRQTGDILALFDDESGWDEPDGNAELREEIDANPSQFVEIPLPDHGCIHDWFRSYLSTLDRSEEYKGSIGRWLSEFATDTERHDWYDFRGKCTVLYAKNILRERGLSVD